MVHRVLAQVARGGLCQGSRRSGFHIFDLRCIARGCSRDDPDPYLDLKRSE